MHYALVFLTLLLSHTIISCYSEAVEGSPMDQPFLHFPQAITISPFSIIPLQPSNNFVYRGVSRDNLHLQDLLAVWQAWREQQYAQKEQSQTILSPSCMGLVSGALVQSWNDFSSGFELLDMLLLTIIWTSVNFLKV